jgi:hypothetical protein
LNKYLKRSVWRLAVRRQRDNGNKLELIKLVLHEPLSQTKALPVATVWIAGTPSDAVCCHRHDTFQSHRLTMQCVICSVFCCVSSHYTISQRPCGVWLYDPQVLCVKIFEFLNTANCFEYPPKTPVFFFPDKL